MSLKEPDQFDSTSWAELPHLTSETTLLQLRWYIAEDGYGYIIRAGSPYDYGVFVCDCLKLQGDEADIEIRKEAAEIAAHIVGLHNKAIGVGAPQNLEDEIPF